MLYLGLVPVVVAGVLVWLHGDAASAARLHEQAGLIPPRHDVDPLLEAASALAHGQGTYPYYGDSVALGYPPPYIPLLVPLALLPRGVAHGVSVLTSGLLTVLALRAWARRDGKLPVWFLALVLSIPVLDLVRIDQLMTAVGFAALTAAIFAQRRDRWWLAGALAAVGMIRMTEALPVIAMLLVGGLGHRGSLTRGVGGAVLVLGPLALVATVWDPHWVQHYAHNLSVLPVVGPLRLVREQFGLGGALALELGGSVAAGALVYPSRGRPLDLDRAALGTAITILVSVVAAYYAAVFVLAALARVAARPVLAPVAWITAFAPWLATLAFAWLVGDGGSGGIANPLVAIDFVLLAGCFPLLRREATLHKARAIDTFVPGQPPVR